MRAQRIKLNLVPGGVIPVVNVSQYDVGRPLEFALYDGPTTATIETGTVIDIRATKPDGTGFEYACTWSGNVVSIATQAQMTVLAGSIECELHLVKNAQEIGTANFILEVEPAALRGDTDISETELPDIIDLARSHEQAAAAAAAAAATSESNAAESETNAAASASAAATSESNAATSESNAAASEAAAATSETNAAASKTAAANSATAASSSASAAATSKNDAEAYAVGKRGGADVPSTDPTYNNNSKYYSEIAQQAAAGGLIPQGTTTFTQLPALADSRVGALWNISDEFTTTADFREGAGIKYGPGADVYKTADGYWDVLAGRGVTGVKGNAEADYRHGDVNITYASLGMCPVANGGTGQTTLALARNAMGLGNTTGALPVANGGTGATTAANALNNLGIAPSSVVDKSSSLSGKGELKYQTIGQLVIVTGRLYGLSSIPTNTLPKPTIAVHAPLAGTGNVQGYLLLETNGVISVSVENTNAGAQARFNFSYVKA